MIYKKFNKFIYNYFFKKENRGETIVMAVDESVMDEFYRKHNVTEEEFRFKINKEFGYSWYSVLSETQKIPQLFGFIAIQIYVAHLMYDGDGYTATAYRPRLATFLSIEEKYELKVLFESCQDKAWKMLRKWAKRNDFILHIPKQKELVWNRRYVTYPLSQALLNQEDLNKAPLLFEKVRLKPNEILSFKDFKYLLDKAERRTYLSNHYKNVKERLIRDFQNDDLLKHQLFDFYNYKWDGYYLEELENGKTQQNKRKGNNNNYTVLTKDFKTINVYDDTDNSLKNEILVNQQDLFRKLEKYYTFPNDEISIFIKHKEYGDYIGTRYLETNKTFILICKKFSEPCSVVNKLDADYVDFSNSYYGIYIVQISDSSSTHYYWKHLFSLGSKICSLEGGLKLSRKVWMKGAGPTIRFEKKTKVFLNGSKLNIDNNLLYSMLEYPEGTYVLVFGEFSPERFVIKAPEFVTTELIEAGWKINEKEPYWEITKEIYQISGLSTKFPVKQERASVRTWVVALNSKSNTKKNSSLVINAIKQSKYGISRAKNNNKN